MELARKHRGAGGPIRILVGRGSTLLPRALRRRGRRRSGNDGGRAARAPLPLRRATGCARPATPPRTRSRPVLYRLVASRRAAAGSRRGARTASSGRCSRSGGRRRAPTVRRTASPTARTPRNAGTKRGLIRARSSRCSGGSHPGRATRFSRASPRSARAAAGARAQLAALLAAVTARSAVDLGGGVRAVREYDGCGWRGRSRSGGPWGAGDPSRPPGSRCARAAPATGSRAGAKKVQDLFVDAKVPRAQRDGWPLVVSGDEVVAVPGVAEAPGWEGRGVVDDGLESGVGEILIEQDPLQRADRASSAPRSRPTTRAGTCSSSASSRAPSSSWPT